ncbi:transglycosylase domain-containing protein [Pseudonocardia sp. CA-107938]|uniref:transglycosylase domain-containing protein n=1 Tax=Pseudonocardia sp. CA-107938 TaxID=3240021 RepID=UPI003D933F8E
MPAAEVEPRHRAGARAEHDPAPNGRRPAAWAALERPPSSERPSRADRQPRTPRELRRFVIKLVLWSLLGVLAAPVLAFGAGYLFFPVPNPDDAVNNQVALVSFADGTQLTRLVPEAGNRTKVGIDAVPVHVREAVLAAEDRTFYSNPGFDLAGIVRAAWNQLRGGVGGGSTITQQFVKNALVGDEQTLWRKYKELVLSVKISQERTKDEILGDYLNAIYFGRGAYGIQSASQAYFGKDVGQVSSEEGALLAGLIQSPSRWDPAINPDRAVQRWNFVLDGMVAQGWLDPAKRAAAQFPATIPRSTATGGGVPSDSSGHIITAVTRELADLGITDQDLAQGGLRITTTIDPVRQQQAVDAAHSALRGQPDDLRSAVVAIDPNTGAILAYYGGDNGHGLDYARTQRLAGSTFKPFVVLAGLLRDPPVGLGETFDGAPRRGLRNAAGADCARCDLKEAMTVSNNVVFASLARKVGPAAVADAARAAGVTAPLTDPDGGIALGNKEVSTIDLASAYATIAAGGVWHPPHLVARVTRADDTVLYQASPQGEQRFPERVARNVTEAMLDVASADGLALPDGRPVAAKTGTVESRVEGQNNDAWMAGFTPTVSTSVWMGTDMNSPIRTSAGTPVEGKSLPGEVWQEFMADAHDDAPVAQFTPFRPIGEPPRSRATAPPTAPPTAAPATPTGTAQATPSGAPAGAPPTGAEATSAPAEPSADAARPSPTASSEPSRTARPTPPPQHDPDEDGAEPVG